LNALSEFSDASVVVISHDEGSRLRETVDGLLGTVPPGTELIVVDDCSTDGSPDFLSKSYFGVQLLEARNRMGVAPARNFGASAASGRVIVFADAHIGVQCGWLPPMLEALRPPEVAAAGPAIGGLEEGSGFGYGLRFVDKALDLEWLDCEGTSPYAVPLLGGAFLAVDAPIFHAIGGFDEGFRRWGSEDLELCLRLWSLGYECRVVPQVVVGHRFRTNFTYAVDPADVLHNLLRLGTVHFGEERLACLIASLSSHGDYPRAAASLLLGDVADRRARLNETRRRDDDEYFARFELTSATEATGRLSN
jgi:glycosyltransferase involved in cell wall biosynthesis